jgi:N-acetylmuramoyl-L-alanine amidase
MAKIVYLDAGHGGKDNGASGNGLKEKDVVLELVSLTKKQLENYQGVDVRLTRSDDRFLELYDRAKLANNAGAELFVSLHINANVNTTANGFETYRYNGSTSVKTRALQNVLHRNIVKRCDFFDDRGQKTANYSVLRNTDMPAILTENGFISNAKDAGYLKDASKLYRIAQGHAEGIAEFLGLVRKDSATTAPATNEKLYRVQVGSFAEEANATALVNKLIKLGYKPYIVES